MYLLCACFVLFCFVLFCSVLCARTFIRYAWKLNKNECKQHWVNRIYEMHLLLIVLYYICIEIMFFCCFAELMSEVIFIFKTFCSINTTKVFGFHGSVHHVDCSKWNQHDAVQQVFYFTLVGCTCFGCRRHPSSGAQYVQSRSVGTMCCNSINIIYEYKNI